MLKRRIISSFNHPAFCSPEGGASLGMVRISTLHNETEIFVLSVQLVTEASF